jgi:hypothetical protein
MTPRRELAPIQSSQQSDAEAKGRHRLAEPDLDDAKPHTHAQSVSQLGSASNLASGPSEHVAVTAGSEQDDRDRHDVVSLSAYRVAATAVAKLSDETPGDIGSATQRCACASS